MYGTDYPIWDPDRSFAALEAAGFTSDVRDRVSGANAERLFGLRGNPRT
jgi:predicted TIM-barrel fold metal-dependent hydrolase